MALRGRFVALTWIEMFVSDLANAGSLQCFPVARELGEHDDELTGQMSKDTFRRLSLSQSKPTEKLKRFQPLGLGKAFAAPCWPFWTSREGSAAHGTDRREIGCQYSSLSPRSLLKIAWVRVPSLWVSVSPSNENPDEDALMRPHWAPCESVPGIAFKAHYCEFNHLRPSSATRLC